MNNGTLNDDVIARVEAELRRRIAIMFETWRTERAAAGLGTNGDASRAGSPVHDGSDGGHLRFRRNVLHAKGVVERLHREMKRGLTPIASNGLIPPPPPTVALPTMVPPRRDDPRTSTRSTVSRVGPDASAAWDRRPGFRPWTRRDHGNAGASRAIGEVEFNAQLRRLALIHDASGECRSAREVHRLLARGVRELNQQRVRDGDRPVIMVTYRTVCRWLRDGDLGSRVA